jgi:hypothetical protein
VWLSNERKAVYLAVAPYLACCRPLRHASCDLRKMENASDKIPVELAKELRKLAHDLSNALETIVQATYLISQAGPPENSRRWVEMIDQASQEAVRINQRLRQVLRQQS